MSNPRESLPKPAVPNPVLKCELSHEIMVRLHQVSDRSGLSIREILSQAIDFAWHVEMSGELSGRYNATDTQRGTTPMNNGSKTPAVMPSEGSERPLAQVELRCLRVSIVRNLLISAPYRKVHG